MEYALLILGIYNILIFLLYGVDKFCSKKGMCRISEETLLLTAFFMGALGGFLGMVLFSHKTRKLKFKILLPIFLIVNIACVVLAMKMI